MSNRPDKKNHVTIAKAIGIILMVAGHSGIPSTNINNFIYIFHMPLFFFCSGYFFKEIYDYVNLQKFCFKRLSGLYVPYIKWSLAFLLFHNLFYYLHLYHFSYKMDDFLWHFIKTVTMSDYEIMLRPFWFLKALLWSSITAGLLSYLSNRLKTILNTKRILFLTLAITLYLKYLDFQLPIIGDCSLITFGIVYIYSGFFYRQYENNFHVNDSVLVVFFFIVLIGSIYFNGIIDMRYTTITNTIPYYILSLLGIILVYEISIRFNRNNYNIIKSTLYYIGNHTMPILSLHLLSFKIGNLAKIWIYDLPIEKLADYTKIPEYNEIFWFVYVFLGVTIPLLINFCYIKLFNNKS